MTARKDAEVFARERFAIETAEHEMTVIRDDGLYRHIRFNKPGTYICGFDLVTWPGYLAIVGDCGDYLFNRIDDMFEFFTQPEISPGYWAEKMRSPSTNTHLVYSLDAFKARVEEWLADVSGDLRARRAASLKVEVKHRLLQAEPYDLHEAMVLLQNFEHDGIRIRDAWEWGDGLMVYDHSFLWCCHAIRWGVERYNAFKKEETSAPA